MNQTRLILGCAACLMFLGVLFGAFGAHALQNRLSPELLTVWQTAVHYQLIHGVALLAIGASRIRGIGHAVIALVMGVCVFSGSLYLLALSGLHWLGAITPFGGLLMLGGWLMLTYQFWRGRVL